MGEILGETVQCLRELWVTLQQTASVSALKSSRKDNCYVCPGGSPEDRPFQRTKEVSDSCRFSEEVSKLHITWAHPALPMCLVAARGRNWKATGNTIFSSALCLTSPGVVWCLGVEEGQLDWMRSNKMVLKLSSQPIFKFFYPWD